MGAELSNSNINSIEFSLFGMKYEELPLFASNHVKKI